MPRRLCLLLASAAACACLSAQAQQIDADDCRDEANHLRHEAAELADAADDLESDEDESGAREVRSHLRDVRDRLARAALSCGAPSTYPAVIASIRKYILLRYRDVPETRARLKVIDNALVSLAQLHVQAQPLDYRMTYAVAETVFDSLGK